MNTEEAPYRDIEDIPLWVALRAPDALAEFVGRTVNVQLPVPDNLPDNVMSTYKLRAKLNYEVPTAIAEKALGATRAVNNKKKVN
jgi:hypothetical protein